MPSEALMAYIQKAVFNEIGDFSFKKVANRMTKMQIDHSLPDHMW
jgi:hypothetical protein